MIRACHELVSSGVAYSRYRDTLRFALRTSDLHRTRAPARSYLHIPSILRGGDDRCDAIPPAMASFREPLRRRDRRQVGVTFIGPSANAIQAMANKVEARKVMRRRSNHHTGTEEALLNVDEARTIAEEIGYPLLLKEQAGVVVAVCGRHHGRRAVEA